MLITVSRKSYKIEIAMLSELLYRIVPFPCHLFLTFVIFGIQFLHFDSFLLSSKLKKL